MRLYKLSNSTCTWQYLSAYYLNEYLYKENEHNYSWENIHKDLLLCDHNYKVKSQYTHLNNNINLESMCMFPQYIFYCFLAFLMGLNKRRYFILSCKCKITSQDCVGKSNCDSPEEFVSTWGDDSLHKITDHGCINHHNKQYCFTTGWRVYL